MKRSAVPSVVLVVAAALVALLVYGVVQRGKTSTLDDQVRKGEKPDAPGQTIALPQLDGGAKLGLSSYKGKVVVLNFWASWCEPCKAEAPVLENAQKALVADHAGTVLGATYRDYPDDSRAFAKRYGFTFPVVRDVATDLASDYGTRKLPETFVLDRKGRIVAISRGQIDQAFMDRALTRARTS